MSSIEVLRDATQTRAAVLALFEWAEAISFAYAWMSADEQRGSPWRALPFAKIEHCVIGLHFAGTDPEVLEQLAERVPQRVRVMYETKGTFHPKVLIGTRGDQARAIVGSSNFTRAAFSSNFEVNLLLTGSKDQSPISDLGEVITSYFRSPKVRQLDPTLLEAYRKVVERGRPKPPQLLLMPRRGQRGPIVKTADHLNIEWDAYLDLLLDQDEREFVRVDGCVRVIPTAADDNAYLTELRWAREAFGKYGSLSYMPPDIREIVAGFGKSLGWFGRMGGAGYYKQLIKSGAKGLSEALDQIPATGDFDEAEFLAASTDALALQGVGLACWTRLLCVKRPDLFLSVNQACVERIREVFGSSPTSVRSYVALTRRVHEFPWVRSAPPNHDAERELWGGRVALLDALFYEPTGHSGPG